MLYLWRGKEGTSRIRRSGKPGAPLKAKVPKSRTAAGKQGGKESERSPLSSYPPCSPSTHTLTGDLTTTNPEELLPLMSSQREPGPGRSPQPGAEAGPGRKEAGSWISGGEGGTRVAE